MFCLVAESDGGCFLLVAPDLFAPSQDCKTLRRPPADLMVRALRSGSKSCAALRLTPCRAEVELAFLGRPADKMRRGEGKVRGESAAWLRVDCAGEAKGSLLAVLGLTAILPPMGLMADRGRTGCFRMVRLGGFSLVLLGLSTSFSRGELGATFDSSKTSHSSLSASAVFLIVRDRTGMQNMELISIS